MPEAKFDPLVAELTNLTSVVDGTIALINAMAAEVLAAKDDPAEIASIVAGYQAQSARLAEANAANTPAAPPA